MTYPVDLSTVTLHATFLDFVSGVPLSGTVEFLPQSVAVAPAGATGLMTGAYAATVSGGEMSISIPVTDDYAPATSYLVTEKLTGIRNRDPYFVTIPSGLAGTTVQLLSLAPAPAPTVTGDLAVPGALVVGGTTVTPPAGTIRVGVAVDITAGGGAPSAALDVRSTNPAVQAALFKHNPTGGVATTHTMTVRQAAVDGSGTGSAINVTSDNVGFTALQVSGIEKNRGTVKVTHRKPGVSDASAAALSIDLQGAGTAAQGVFVTGTNGPTTGNLLTLRNNGRDDLVVKGTGRVGVGVATGATPGGMVGIQQTDDTSKGLFVKANSAASLGLIEGQNSAGTAVFIVSPGGDLTALGRALGVPQPADHGLYAWTYDPAHVLNSSLLVNGTQYLVGLYVPQGRTVTKVYWHNAVVAVTPTAGQNEVSLFDAAGNRLAVTNVDADITSTGLKTTTVSSTNLLGGAMYYVSFVFNAATAPTLGRTTGLAGAGGLINVGLSPSTYRFATNGTGRTATPASITPASASQGLPLWAAVGP